MDCVIGVSSIPKDGLVRNTVYNFGLKFYVYLPSGPNPNQSRIGFRANIFDMHVANSYILWSEGIY